MNDIEEPLRLAAGRDPNLATLRASLQAARADLPSPARLNAILAHGPAAIPPWWAAGAKLAVATVVVSAAAGGAWWRLSSEREAPAARPPHVAAPVVPAPSAIVPAAPIAPPRPRPVAVRAPVAAERRPVVPAPAAERDPPLTVASPGPRLSVDDIGKEAALIESARSALAADPARALDMLARHHAQFPAGLLVEEASALRVETLGALGRTREAADAAASFEQSHPRSPYLGRVHRWRDARP